MHPFLIDPSRTQTKDDGRMVDIPESIWRSMLPLFAVDSAVKSTKFTPFIYLYRGYRDYMEQPWLGCHT